MKDVIELYELRIEGSPDLWWAFKHVNASTWREGKPTGRTWTLDNRSDASLTYVCTRIIHATASQTRTALIESHRVNRDPFRFQFAVWPAVHTHADLIRLAWIRRGLREIHPGSSPTCCYCRSVSTWRCLFLWARDTRTATVGVSIMASDYCSARECMAFAFRSQYAMMRAFDPGHVTFGPRRRQCHQCFLSCMHWVSGRKFKMCSGCWAAYYCSVKCQRLHWPKHRELCHFIARFNRIEDDYDDCGLSIDAIWGLVKH